MKTYTNFISEADDKYDKYKDWVPVTPEVKHSIYYKTSKNTPLKKIAKRYYATGDKLYDVDWVRGDYHIMAPVKDLDSIKEHNWSRKKSRRSAEDYEELYQDIKNNGIQQPIQVFLYQYENRAVLGEGNHRLAIAKELGIKKIPTVFTFWKGTKPEKDEGFDKIMDKFKADKEEENTKRLFKKLGINI